MSLLQQARRSAAHKLPASQNIGPSYLFMGGACVAALVWLYHTKACAETHWQDVAVYVTLALLALSFWRPPLFDALVRSIATKLPWVKYAGDAMPAGRGAKVDE